MRARGLARLRFFFLQSGFLRDFRRLRFCAAASALGLAALFFLRLLALTGVQPGLGLRRLRFRLAACREVHETSFSTARAAGDERTSDSSVDAPIGA